MKKSQTCVVACGMNRELAGKVVADRDKVQRISMVHRSYEYRHLYDYSSIDMRCRKPFCAAAFEEPKATRKLQSRKRFGEEK